MSRPVRAGLTMAAFVAVIAVTGWAISCSGGGTDGKAPTQTEVTAPELSARALAMVGKTYTCVQTVRITVTEIGGDVALVDWRIDGNQKVNEVPVLLTELEAMIYDGPSGFVETITETVAK